MNFRKLGKKLSAILCSSMMFGGSSVSNRLAMAGGIRVAGWSGVGKFGAENYKMSWFNLAYAFRNIAQEEKFQIYDGGMGSEVDHSYYFEVGGKKIGLHSKGFDGFAVSIDKGTNNEIKCGIFPFSYFYHCMNKAGIGVGDFKRFNEMTQDVQVKFLRGLGKGFFGADYGDEKFEINSAEDFARFIDERVAPDKKEFGEMEDDVQEGYKQPISVLAVGAFLKAEPAYSDGKKMVYDEKLGIFVAEEEKNEMRTPGSEMDCMEIEIDKFGKPIGIRRRRGKNRKVIIGLSVFGGGLILGSGIGIPLAIRSKSAKNRKINAEKLLSQSRAVLSNSSQIGKNENKSTKTSGQGKPNNIKVNEQMKSKRIQTDQRKKVGKTKGNRFNRPIKEKN